MAKKNGAAKRILFKLIQVGRLHHNILDHKVSEFKLYRSQHQLLRYLLDTKTLLSQKDISGALDISAAAVAKTIKKLEQEGLISKMPSAEDQRINLIDITKEGRKILEQTREIFDLLDQEVIRDISEEELDIMFKVLSKMEHNLLEMGAVDRAAVLYKIREE